MPPVCVINVVGLTPRHLGEDTPKINEIASKGFASPMSGVLPAVTCSAQATMLTGKPPSGHGVVGNGWYSRELGEVQFWKQSNALVGAPKIYETARRRNPAFTCAKMFWWFNQGAAADWSVTPKPHYGSDGSKVFGIQSTPPHLATELEGKLGPFPFFSFWGPKAGLPCSDWIARASAHVIRSHRPTLSLVYLPHLDYDFQRFGPSFPGARRRVREVDARAGVVADEARAQGAQVIVLSEYGIAPVSRPVHINRALREAGWLTVRPGPFGEMLDPYQSKAFAVADHQIAHVYVTDPKLLPAVRERLLAVEGIDGVLDGDSRARAGLDHPRAGDLIAMAKPDAWFTYYYWLDDRLAPDFARTVDIHRKPGYDPMELFVDPALVMPGLRIGWALLMKALGARYRMNVISLDASAIRGSHGLAPADPKDGPVFVCSAKSASSGDVTLASVHDRILSLLFS